ncbi:MAG: sugar ABC transporter ATP-binding protein [Deltaproteobacteria bacterium]|nr:sugar ABC transporter ATP-binding protein [Deltaproteobacteria bacterium]
MTVSHSGKPVIDVDGLGIFYRLQQRRRVSIKKVLLGGGFRRDAPLLWALRDVSFRCHEGEILGVIGPNGAGKSTLCLALSQILTPDEGEVAVSGEVSTLLSLGAGFNRDLSGRENIYLNAAFLGISRAEIEGKMQEIIEFSELGEFIDQPIRFYSSGMKSRLGFSVAASLEPEILILDEVLSVGDHAFQQKSRRRLQGMMDRSRVIVLVSHSVEFLRELCTHALWLEKGRVRGFGAAKEVLDGYLAASTTEPVQE